MHYVLMNIIFAMISLEQACLTINKLGGIARQKLSHHARRMRTTVSCQFYVTGHADCSSRFQRLIFACIY